MIVDLSFRVRGSEIPVDHGYALYSAVSHVIPFLHGDQAVGIHPINGSLIGGRLLRLNEGSRLTLRIPDAHIRDAMPLSGKRLEVDGYPFVVGIPSPRLLQPASTLRSRIVIIKGFLEPEPFLDACRRQLSALEVSGEVGISQRTLSRPVENGPSQDRSPLIRRTIKIHDKVIVGYAVQVEGVSPDQSIRLQEAGLGGRRRFGCGVFTPFEDRASP